MSEGGYLPWKRQNVVAPPSANYASLQKPMKLPEGKAWHLDPQTKEWKVIELENNKNITVGVPLENLVHTGKDADDGTKVNKTNSDHAEDNVVMEKNKNELLKIATNDGDDHVQPPILHVVKTSDTMQGICLKYKISPVELRRTNRFSGSNLLLAPSTLVIPIESGNPTSPKPQTLSPQQIQESKINSFLLQFRSKRSEIGRKEALAYLKMCDWTLEEAIQDAKDDFGWENGDEFSEQRSLV